MKWLKQAGDDPMSARRAGVGLMVAAVVGLVWLLGTPSYAQEMPMWTPAAGPGPRINGPKVYGCRPGKPFLYRIPCTGDRPLGFSVEGLPAGLELDAATGIMQGRTPDQEGRYKLLLKANNGVGEVERELTLVVGQTLALTPPMGFNDWYTWYDRITQKDMVAAAEALISSGMADHGYNYVNIDDCWMVKAGSDDLLLGAEKRDETTGAIRPNGRFLDMKGLADYHSFEGPEGRSL